MELLYDNGKVKILYDGTDLFAYIKNKEVELFVNPYSIADMINKRSYGYCFNSLSDRLKKETLNIIRLNKHDIEILEEDMLRGGPVMYTVTVYTKR